LLPGVPVPLDQTNFDRYLRFDGLPMLVDFWAPWCVLAASGIRAILAARKRALRRVRVIEVGIMGPSSETPPNARHAESRACLARRRNHLTSKAKTVPEIHENASIARKARISTAINTRTPADKIRLFRSLFRGREDIFPTRFVSAKTGKSGYAPACRNKFVRSVCQLPKVRCGDCPNQAFTPFDDTAVVGHLTGRHLMGIYPLLADESCWFLAVDFDKSTWIEDVGAFVETFRRVGLPAAVERSRSGNGAHVWFFFSSPVPAAAARKMGCYLITETMSRRHELSMESYDRLFPSQDTMPRGGFGNLIALPLQHGPRALGNSVFIDDQLRPYPDDEQWSYLVA
jgi:hypothetical protein